jgi:hypothetical protein
MKVWTNFTKQNIAFGSPQFITTYVFDKPMGVQHKGLARNMFQSDINRVCRYVINLHIISDIGSDIP